MSTAFLVDGEFFIRRCRALYGDKTPEELAKILHSNCLRHLSDRSYGRGQKQGRRELYRIYFYDCLPLSKKVHNPIDGRSKDYAKDPKTVFRLALHEELKKLRLVALRFGFLDESNAKWSITTKKAKEMMVREPEPVALSPEDVYYEIRQKGVDMRIGIDIASLAYKRLVDQIVLISGDSDFIPAAKLARREGIDFVLDPMWAHIKPDLDEHIDGLRSTAPRPTPKKVSDTAIVPKAPPGSSGSPATV